MRLAAHSCFDRRTARPSGHSGHFLVVFRARGRTAGGAASCPGLGDLGWERKRVRFFAIPIIGGYAMKQPFFQGLARILILFVGIGPCAFWSIPDTQDSTGAGLELAIAREIIVSQRGSIGLESTSGKGSEFYFDLPATCNGVKA
jgi:hypothetical protein